MSRAAAMEQAPVLLGFQMVRGDEPRSLAWRNRRAVTMYARRNGFRLGRIYVHQGLRGQPGALGALLRAATHPQVTTVAITSERDLGESPRMQAVIRMRLERSAKVQVVVVGR